MGIIIQRANGSNGRSAPGFSYYTGGMFYGTAPSGWTSYTHPLYPSVIIKAKQILSAPAALTAGILPNTDNTAASGTIAWGTGSSLGTLAAGDVITVSVVVAAIGGTTSTVAICAYTCVSADISDTTGAALNTAITLAINSNTYLTGFSATHATNITTIIAPTSQGKYLNTTSATIAITNGHTMTNTIVAFSLGTASVYADAYYQISEYFRLNPTGNLWIGFISASSTWHELLALQLASGNQLRQIWIADISATNGLAANLLATVTSIQATATLLSQTSPFEVIYRPNIIAVTDPSTLPNGQTLSATNNVQVLISQDGNAQGALLFATLGYSISNLGAKCGTLSASRLSASDAQPIDTFNVSNGIENNVPALSNGNLMSAISVSLYQQLFGGTQNNTSGYCYVGFVTYPGNVSGTYWTGNPMFITGASRYAYMNDNRVWDEITRILQQTYIPYLNSEVQFNPDGTISNSSIVFLQNLGNAAITAGLITGQNPPMISGAPNVTISPSQPLQQTNVLLINVQTEENGITRNITITNGFSN